MTAEFALDSWLVLAGVLLVLSAVASKAPSRLGIPILVVFMLFGTLLGSEGIGGIYFDNAKVARDIGTVALVFILFGGGLDTDWRVVKPVLGPSLSLATAGVFITAVSVAAFCHWFLGFEFLHGLLLGAIVSSTDAAAVFGVLRARGLRLRRRLGPIIEFESGSNDPMAVFLTLGVIGLIQSEKLNLWPIAGSFVVQMLVGASAGWIIGILATRLINRVRLDYDGLYPAITIGTALLAYSVTQALGGNGFLAVYAAGVSMARVAFVHRASLIRFHDAIAWLMQISMFLVLGLLVFPSQLPPVASPGLAIAFFLMFIARPLAVFVSLAPFRMHFPERLFIAWVGLRGAVPIVLATMPLTSGVEGAQRMFNLVFFAVVASVLFQATTIGFVAKRLRVMAPPPDHPQGRSATHANTILIQVAPGSPADGLRVVDLRLPNTAMLVLLTRNNRSFVPQGSTVLLPEDELLLATRKDDIDELTRTITGRNPADNASEAPVTAFDVKEFVAEDQSN